MYYITKIIDVEEITRNKPEVWLSEREILGDLLKMKQKSK